MQKISGIDAKYFTTTGKKRACAYQEVRNVFTLEKVMNVYIVYEINF